MADSTMSRFSRHHCWWVAECGRLMVIASTVPLMVPKLIFPGTEAVRLRRRANLITRWINCYTRFVGTMVRRQGMTRMAGLALADLGLSKNSTLRLFCMNVFS